MLFIGTLAFANNSSAVEWYVSKVHKLLCDVVGYNFVVAGNTVGESAEVLKRMVSPYPNITLIENPKEIGSLYGSAAVFVNPVPRGAGLKMKTIDAIQAGLPVVTTSTGVEGTGLLTSGICSWLIRPRNSPRASERYSTTDVWRVSS